MSNAIGDSLNNVLLTVAAYRKVNQRLVCFHPMKGAAADGRLMLVGRALNRWGNEFTAPQMMDAAVFNHWREKRDYYPERSSFWMVALSVLDRLEHSDGLPQSYLYWTNLYKVSPAQSSKSRNTIEKDSGECL